jgi:hypothetical protein
MVPRLWRGGRASLGHPGGIDLDVITVRPGRGSHRCQRRSAPQPLRRRWRASRRRGLSHTIEDRAEQSEFAIGGRREKPLRST